MITVLNGNALQIARRHLDAAINLAIAEAERERERVKREALEWVDRRIAFWNRSRAQKRRWANKEHSRGRNG